MAETTDHPFKDFLATLRDEWERKTLLDFLRSEIDRQETESKRPGWTTWALCAAGAALISCLLSALEPAGLNWQTVGVLFVLLSIAVDCLRILANVLRGTPENPESQRRFHLTSAYATDSRLFAAAMLIRLLIVYGVYRSVQFGLHPLFYKSLVTFLGLNIFLAGSILILSCLRLPTPKSTNTKCWWALRIVVTLWVGTGIVGCIGIVPRLQSLSPSIQDWRVATALVGISLVVLLLSRLQQAPALLEDLKGIERRLALGQLTLAEAREKTDRILHGLTFGDIMQPYVREALHDIDSLESEHKELTAEFQVMRGAIGDLAVEVTQEQMTTITALFRGIQGKADDVKKKGEDTKSSLTKLTRRVHMLKRIAPPLAAEMTSLMSEVQSAATRLEQAFDQAEKSLLQLISEVKPAFDQAKKSLL